MSLQSDDDDRTVIGTMISASRIVRADLVGTVVFAATAVFAAVTFSTTAQWVGAITAIVLFAAGVFAFLWSYVHALGRSRADEISVAGLYLLTGSATPASVKRTLWLCLVAQVAIALATTLTRPNGPDGNPGSSLAVGFLVAMFGLGLNGLWTAFHGEFSPRRDLPPDTAPDEVPTEPDAIGQNADHG